MQGYLARIFPPSVLFQAPLSGRRARMTGFPQIFLSLHFAKIPGDTPNTVHLVILG